MTDETKNDPGTGRGYYEKLLLQRDALRKEADRIMALYIREFGTLAAEVFEKKIRCIALKKAISLCQAAANRGEAVDLSQLNSRIEQEMASYNRQLQDMLRDNESCRNMKTVTQTELLRTKKLYRKIAKLIHPDLNPAAAAVPEIAELWQRVMDAYHCSDAAELENLEFLVNSTLERLGLEHEETELPDLADRIEKLEEEIRTIRSTDPYCLREILDDPEAVEQRRQELKEQLEEYERYRQELTRVLAGLTMGQGGTQWTIPW